MDLQIELMSGVLIKVFIATSGGPHSGLVRRHSMKFLVKDNKNSL